MAIQGSGSRPGQANNSGDDNALFLKVFSGEIISAFEDTNLMLPLHRVRTIASGKSAQFPVTGLASALYHVPGESVLGTGGTTGYGSTTSGATTAVTVAFDGGAQKYGSKIPHAERVISIDDLLISSTFVANIDEMKSAYDVRSVYSREIGRALAVTADKNMLRTVISGARTTADRFGGSNALYLGAKIDLSLQATATASSDLISGIFAVAQLMDEKNVPSDGRCAVFTPGNYYKLVNGDGAKIAINRDWGGNGSFANGSVVEIAGIKIFKSNHLPSVSETTTQLPPHSDAGVKNDVFATAGVGYGGVDFSITQGIAFQTDGIGTVKLMDLSVSSDYIPDRIGTLLLAKYAMGHGVLREEACFEFVT